MVVKKQRPGAAAEEDPFKEFKHADEKRKLAAEEKPQEDDTQKKQLEQHWLRAIANWTASDMNRPLCITHANMLSEETVAAWEASLKSKNYTVTNVDGRLTVSI